MKRIVRSKILGTDERQSAQCAAMSMLILKREDYNAGIKLVQQLPADRTDLILLLVHDEALRQLVKELRDALDDTRAQGQHKELLAKADEVLK